MTIKIERNIPIVARGGSKGIADALRTMKVGDSIFAGTRHRAIYLCNTLSRLGYRGTMRGVDGGWRVWRIADEREAAE